MDLIVGWWYYTELTMLPAIEAEPVDGLYLFLFIGLWSELTFRFKPPFRVISTLYRSAARLLELREHHDRLLYDSRCIAGAHDLFNNARGAW